MKNLKKSLKKRYNQLFQKKFQENKYNYNTNHYIQMIYKNKLD